VGPVGSSVVVCVEHKKPHEIDVLGLARGAQPRTANTPVAFLGEAKNQDRRPTMSQLSSREHTQALLIGAGHDAHDAVQALQPCRIHHRPADGSHEQERAGCCSSAWKTSMPVAYNRWDTPPSRRVQSPGAEMRPDLPFCQAVV
jgi:hypothetical protein